MIVLACTLPGLAAAASAPANDAFAAARALTGQSGTVTGSNVGATRETGEPTIAGNAGGQSVWFSWTAPATGTATVDTVGSSFDTLLGVYTGSSVSALTLVASNDDLSSSTYQSRVTFSAAAGATYRIAVDGYHSNTRNTTASGSVTLNWSESGSAPPPPPPPSGPANDPFAGAQAVSAASGSATGSNQGATRESGEPTIAGNAGGASVWFSWTAPSSGTATVDTTGSAIDTLLGVYTGSAVSALTLVASNDDLSSSVYQSKVTFPVTAGTTYKIAIDGYHSNSSGSTAQGALKLNWSTATSAPPPPPPPPPPSGGGTGDAFAQALAISGTSGSTTGSTVGATKEAGEPAHATNAGGHSIWFRWTAPQGGTATFSTAGSNFDTTLAVYTGSSVSALTWVSSNDDASSAASTSALTFIPTAGVTYSIAVDGWDGASGSVNLAWSMGTETLPGSGDPVLVAAGDVHANCTTSQAGSTAQAIDATGANAVVADGDLSDTGSYYQMDNCFGSTWGRFGSRLYSVLGNHEYTQANAGPYFSYFGSNAGTAGQGWYSFNLGTWHVVVLNSNCSLVGGCGSGSPQLTWLQQDLAAHPTACTLAFWHHPLFTSVPEPSGNDQTTAPLWDALSSAGADVVVNAHSRSYERFAPQTSAGVADAQHGIREFVTGTGGGELDGSRPSTAPNSEAWQSSSFGVLRLALHAGSYDWSFVNAGSGTYADSGTTACH